MLNCIGAGNTGCDVAVDAGTHAETAVISMRRGYYFIPKRIFGKPADVFAHDGPALPPKLQRFVIAKLLRLLQGDLTRFGLPAPDHQIFETHPVLNSQIIHALSHGDVTVRPDVKRFDGRVVVFEDGREQEFDLVMYCTGYHPSLPFVDVSVYRTGDVSNFYLNGFHQDHPRFFMVGNSESDAGGGASWHDQTKLVAKVIQSRDADSPGIAAFDRLRLGKAPDLTNGVRYMNVERMSTYVSAVALSRETKRASLALG